MPQLFNFFVINHILDYFVTHSKHHHMRYLTLLGLILIVSSANAQDFGELKKLNDAEKRLIEFKDSDEMLGLKIKQLAIINQSRKKYKAAPVKLDILASRVANKQCKEAAEGEFRGHWNMRGEKPYHRYAFAGGTDHVTENAAATWIQGGTFDGKPETHAKLMADLHGEFMAEKKPQDGHKQTIIQKDHNYVGIGAFMTSTHFRYYEEFIDRYAEIGAVPQRVKVNQEFTVSIKPNNGLYLFYGAAYYEKVPKPMTQSAVNKKSSYPDYTDSVPVKYAPWDIAKFRDANGTYNIPWSFDKKGLYYIQLLVDKKDPSSLTSFNTDGKTIVSGIVVIVE